MANLHILGRAWLAYPEDNDGKLVNGMIPRSPEYANLQYWLTNYVFNGPYMDNAWWVNPPIKADGTYAGGLGGDFVCSLDDEDNGIRSGKLFPYVGSSAAYHCPGDRSYLKATDRGGRRSYSISAMMHGEQPNSIECAHRYSEIRNPSTKLVFMETTDIRGWNMGSWMMNAPTPPSWIDPISGWHQYRSGLGFADGHGELHLWVDPQTREMIDSGWWGMSNSVLDLAYLAGVYLPKR